MAASFGWSRISLCLFAQTNFFISQRRSITSVLSAPPDTAPQSVTEYLVTNDSANALYVTRKFRRLLTFAHTSCLCLRACEDPSRHCKKCRCSVVPSTYLSHHEIGPYHQGPHASQSCVCILRSGFHSLMQQFCLLGMVLRVGS